LGPKNSEWIKASGLAQVHPESSHWAGVCDVSRCVLDTNLIGHIVNGKQRACDRFMRDNCMKVSARILSTRGAATGAINRLKVFSVPLMLQLQLTSRYQSHSEPLSNTKKHMLTTQPLSRTAPVSQCQKINGWYTPLAPQRHESQVRMRVDGIGATANAQSGKLGPGTTPDPTNNSLNLLDIFPVLFGANGLIQTSSLTTHLDTNLFRSSMPLFQSSPPLQICNARFPSCHNPPDINYAITHYTVTSWIFQLAGGKNLLSHTSM